jgi:hypothetical protein
VTKQPLSSGLNTTGIGTASTSNQEHILQIKEIKRGELRKKNRFFMQQTRTFVLTSEPRLKYYKNESDFRGEIPLTNDVVAKIKSDGSFKLCT